MSKIEWLGTPIGCPCFFSEAPPTPEGLGQITLRTPSGTTLFPRFPQPRRAPQLRTPPARTLPCRGTLSFAEGHTHYIFLLTQTPGFLPVAFNGMVYISWQDVRANVDKSYVTTVQNNHTHTLLLTAAEFSTLRSGGSITKQTSISAAPGGRRHTHTVTLTCNNPTPVY